MKKLFRLFMRARRCALSLATLIVAFGIVAPEAHAGKYTNLTAFETDVRMFTRTEGGNPQVVVPLSVTNAERDAVFSVFNNEEVFLQSQIGILLRLLDDGTITLNHPVLSCATCPTRFLEYDDEDVNDLFIPAVITLAATPANPAAGDAVMVTATYVDPDGTRGNFCWEAIAAPDVVFTVSSQTPHIAQFTMPAADSITVSHAFQSRYELTFPGRPARSVTASRSITLGAQAQAQLPAPTVMVTAPTQVDEGQLGTDGRTVATATVVTLTATAMRGAGDEDSTLMYLWRQVVAADPSAATAVSLTDNPVALSGDTSSTVSFAAPDVGRPTPVHLHLNVSAMSGARRVSTDAVSTVIINDVEPPSAAIRFIPEGATAGFSADGLRVLQNTTTTFSILRFDIDEPTIQLQSNLPFDLVKISTMDGVTANIVNGSAETGDTATVGWSGSVPALTTATLAMIVSDSQGLVVSSTADIVLCEESASLMAVAGADLEVASGADVPLSGAGSRELCGSATDTPQFLYSWEKVVADSVTAGLDTGVTLETANRGTTWTAPSGVRGEQDHYFRLTLLDRFTGLMSRDVVAVTVTGTPVQRTVSIVSGPDDVEEGQTASVTIGLREGEEPSTGETGATWEIVFGDTVNDASASDFTTVSGETLIPQGATMATISLPTVEDNSVEPQESYTFRLVAASGDSGARLGTASTATANIEDNDVLLAEITSAQIQQPDGTEIVAGTPVSDKGGDGAATVIHLVASVAATTDTAVTQTASWAPQSEGLTIADATTLTGVVTLPDVNTTSAYSFVFTLVESKAGVENVTATEVVMLTVVDTDAPTVSVEMPTAQVVRELTESTLRGTGMDAGDTNLRYQWTQQSPQTPVAALGDATSSITTVTWPDVSAATAFTLRLTVTDSQELVASTSVVVTVADAAPPTAEAGTAPTASPGDTVTLDGSGSRTARATADNLVYLWRQVDSASVDAAEVTGGVDLTTPGMVTTTFTAPAQFGDYHFHLTVTDSVVGLSSSDIVTVAVAARSVPAPTLSGLLVSPGFGRFDAHVITDFDRRSMARTSLDLDAVVTRNSEDTNPESVLTYEWHQVTTPEDTALVITRGDRFHAGDISTSASGTVQFMNGVGSANARIPAVGVYDSQLYFFRVTVTASKPGFSDAVVTGYVTRGIQDLDFRPVYSATLNGEAITAGSVVTLISGETYRLEGSAEIDVGGMQAMADEINYIYQWFFLQNSQFFALTSLAFSLPNQRILNFTVPAPARGTAEQFEMRLLLSRYEIVPDGTVDGRTAGQISLQRQTFNAVWRDNTPPTADAGTDIDSVVGDHVMLDGSGSRDSRGGENTDQLSYQWQQVESEAANAGVVTDGLMLVSSMTETTTVTAPTQAGSYYFRLTVADSQTLLTATDVVRLDVMAIPPMVAVTVGTQVGEQTRRTELVLREAATGYLTATGTDLDGGSDGGYQWSQVTPAGRALLDAFADSTTAAAVELTAPQVIAAGERDEYVLRVTYTDDNTGVTASSDVMVVVLDSTMPTADAGGNQTVSMGDSVTLDGSGSRDSRGGENADRLSYAWQQVTDSDADFMLSSTETAVLTFTAASVGDYVFRLTVMDGVTQLSASTETTVTVTPPRPMLSITGGLDRDNQTPLIELVVREATTAYLTAIGTDLDSGSDGDYEWSQVTPPGGALLAAFTGSTTAADVELTAPEVVAAGERDEYVLRVTYTDENTRVSAASDVRVFVLDSTPPTADAGENQTVGMNDVVTLDGSGSRDSRGGGNADRLSYVWEQVTDSEADFMLSSTQTAVATFTAASTGTYVFRLTVTDGVTELSDSTTATVTVGTQRPGLVVRGNINSTGFESNVGTAFSDTVRLLLGDAQLNRLDADNRLLISGVGFRAAVGDGLAQAGEKLFGTLLAVGTDVDGGSNGTYQWSGVTTADEALITAIDLGGFTAGDDPRAADSDTYDIVRFSPLDLSPPVATGTRVDYRLRVTYTDANTSVTNSVLVTVTFVEATPPVADAGEDRLRSAGQALLSGDTLTLDGRGSLDSRGIDGLNSDRLSYLWEELNDDSLQAALRRGGFSTRASVANIVLDLDLQGITQAAQSFYYRLTVTDRETNTSDTDLITVEVTAPPPMLEVTGGLERDSQTTLVAPLVLYEGEAGYLTAFGTDFRTLGFSEGTYRWEQVSPAGDALFNAATITIVDSSLLNTTALSTLEFTAAPEVSRGEVQEYVLRVTYTDGRTTVENSRDITVRVLDSTPPVANAGDDESVESGQSVVLDGSASLDSGGQDAAELVYEWQQVASTASDAGVVPGGVVLTTPRAVMSGFTAPAAQGDFYFRLSVTDTQTLLGARDVVTVQVSAPVSRTVSIVSGPDDVEEGQAASVTIGLDANDIPSTGEIGAAWEIAFGGTENDASAADFVMLSGVALIPRGLTMTMISLPTVNDDLVEPLEAYTFRLTAPEGNRAALGTTTTTARIEDNDALLPEITDTQVQRADRTEVAAGTPVPDKDGDGAATMIRLVASVAATTDTGVMQTAFWAPAQGSEGLTITEATTLTGVVTLPSVNTTSIYSFVFTLGESKAGVENVTATEVVMVTVVDTDAPTVSVEPPTTPVRELTESTLRGTGTDAEDTALAYRWTQQSPQTPVAALGDATSSTTTVTWPDITDSTAFTLRLTVTDSQGLTSSASVVVTVENAPRSVAGVNQEVLGGDTVTLDGSASRNARNTSDDLDYLWQQVESAGVDAAVVTDGVVLTTPDSAATTFVAPVQFGDYHFRLTITDTQVQLGSIDHVTVSVVRNTRGFMVNAGEPQNVDEGALVTLSGSVIGGATDYRYQWTQVDAAYTTAAAVTENALTLTGASGTPDANAGGAAMATFTAPPVIAPTPYYFRLTGSSEAFVWMASDVVVVTVNDTAPPTAQAGEDLSEVRENVAVTLAGMVTDPDGDTNLTVSWIQQQSVPSVIFSDSSAVNSDATWSGVSSGSAATVTLALTVTDSQGLVASDTVNVTVLDDTLPTADAGMDAEFISSAQGPLMLDGSASRDSRGGDNVAQLIYQWQQVTAANATAGPVTSGVTLMRAESAQASFATPAIGDYHFRLTVSDTVTLLGSIDHVTVRVEQDPATIMVTVADDQTVNEGDFVALSGRAIGQFDDLTYQWTQVDAAYTTASAVTEGALALTGAAGTPGNDGVATATFTALDVAGPTTYYFRLTVSATVQSVTFSDSAVIAVAVNDTEPPTAEAGAALGEVRENVAVTLAGTATDPDGDTDLTVLWSQQQAAPSVTFSDPSAVNSDATWSGVAAGSTATVTLTLTVTDSQGLVSTDTVTATVIDDTPPTADAGGDFRVTMGETASLDGDGSLDSSGAANTGRLSYRWQQVDSSDAAVAMVVVGGLALTTPEEAGATFEAPPGLQGLGDYYFRLTVTDSVTGLSDSDIITVAVTNPLVPAPIVSGLTVQTATPVDPFGRHSFTALRDFNRQTGARGALPLTAIVMRNPADTAPVSTLTYEWHQVASTASDAEVVVSGDWLHAGEIVDATGTVDVVGSTGSATARLPSVDVNVQGFYHFRLTVTASGKPGYADTVVRAYATYAIAEGDLLSLPSIVFTEITLNGVRISPEGENSRIDETDTDVVMYSGEQYRLEVSANLVDYDGTSVTATEENTAFEWAITGIEPAGVDSWELASTAANALVFTAPERTQGTAFGGASFSVRLLAPLRRDFDGTPSGRLITDRPLSVTARFRRFTWSDDTPPLADAGMDRESILGVQQTVTLDGSGSRDSRGGENIDQLSYQWQQVESAAADAGVVTGGLTLADATAATATVTAPTQAGSYYFRLTVADSQTLLTATDVVRLDAVSLPPTVAVTAGTQVGEQTRRTELVLREAATGYLTATGTDLGGGSTGGYQWSQVTPAGRALLDAFAGSTTAAAVELTAPQVIAAGERDEYVLRVTYTDGDTGVTASSDVMVVVLDSTMPTADAGGDRTVSMGDSVTLDGSGSRDSRGGENVDRLSYVWQQLTASADDFMLASTETAVLTFTAASVGDYVFRLTVMDGVTQLSASTETTVTVTVPRPMLSISGGLDRDSQTPLIELAVSEGTTGYLTAIGTDLQGGSDGDYQWSQVTPPGGALLAAFTGSTTAAEVELIAPEVAAAGERDEYVLRVTYTDENTRVSAASDVRVFAVDSTPPTADAGEDQTVGMNDDVTLDGSGSRDSRGGENADRLSYVWEQVTDSEADFMLTSTQTAVATFTAASTGTYVFRLTVTDGVTQRSASTETTVTVGAQRPGLVVRGVNTATDSDSQNVGFNDRIGIRVLFNMGTFNNDLDADNRLLISGPRFRDSRGHKLFSILLARGTDVDGESNGTYQWSGVTTADNALLTAIDVGSFAGVEDAFALDIVRFSPLDLPSPVPAGTRVDYRLRVTYTDANTSVTNSVLVTVTFVEATPPVADAGEDRLRSAGQALLSGDTLTLDGRGSLDSRGIDGLNSDRLSYLWEELNDDSLQAALRRGGFSTRASVANIVLDLDLQGITQSAQSFYYRLTVTDRETNTSDTDLITVDVTAPAPMLEVTGGLERDSQTALVAPLVLYEGEAGYLTAIGTDFRTSGFSEGTYLWEQVSPAGDALLNAATITIVDSSLLNTTALSTLEFTAAPEVSRGEVQEYVLRVTYTDGRTTVENSRDITVRVLDSTLPVANAGADQSVESGESVVLDGSASRDSGGQDAAELIYEWQQVESAALDAGVVSGGVVLTTPRAVMSGFTAPVQGDFYFRLSVTDTQTLLGARDIVTVQVSVPVSRTVSIVSGPDDVEEGQMASVTIGLDAGEEPSAGGIGATWQIVFGDTVNDASAADFMMLGGDALIPRGSTMMTISLPTVDDPSVEPQETYTFRLTAPLGSRVILGTTTMTTARIEDNDALLPEITSAQVQRADGTEVVAGTEVPDKDGAGAATVIRLVASVAAPTDTEVVQTVSWAQQAPGSEGLTIAGASSLTGMVSLPSEITSSTYSFVFTLAESKAGVESVTATAVVMLTVVDTDAPTVSITPPQTPVRALTESTLRGMGADADDDPALRYQWTQESPDAPALVLSDATSSTTTVTWPNVDAGTAFTLVLTVTDSQGLASSASVVVTVETAATPTAQAGGAQTAFVGDTVTLDGSGSRNARDTSDGLIYLWQQVQSAGADAAVVTDGVDLTTPASATATFVAPIQLGAYHFRLTVTDTQTTLASSDIATVTIDAPARTLGIMAGPDDVVEGATANVTISLGAGQRAADDNSIGVSWELVFSGSDAASAADFATTAGQAFIQTGSNSVMIGLETVDDMVAENAETYTFRLTAVSGANVTLREGLSSSSAAIADNDVIEVGFAQAAYSVTENTDETVEVCADIAQPAVLERTFSLEWSTRDGTAGGDDYSAAANQQIVFDNSNMSVCFEVGITGDPLVEIDETFFVDLAAVAGETLPERVSINTPTTTVTINDDDMIVIGWQGNADVLEASGTVALTVVISAPAPDVAITRGDFSLEFSTVDGTADNTDYTPVSNQRIGPFGNATRSQSVTIAIADDTLAEQRETFEVVLRFAGEIPQGTTISPATSVVGIVDDDSVQVSVSAVNATVAEGGAANPAFDLEISQMRATPTTVNWTLSGTALRDVDYTMAGVTADQPTTMVYQTVIPANANSARVEFVLVDDTLNEADETITITLGNQPEASMITAGQQSVGTVTIEDNDTLMVSVTAPDSATASEGDSVMFTVRHDGSTQTSTVVVDYEISLGEGLVDAQDIDGDLMGSVMIPSGATSTEIVITLADDTVVEPAETLTVELTAARSAGVVGIVATASSASVVIQDNDRVQVSVSAVAASVDEDSGSMLQFDLMASQEFTEATTVSWMLGGTALRGVDYTGNAVATGQPTTMTYSTVMPADTTSVRVEFALVDDTLNEAAETITMTLVAPADSAFETATQAEGMITIEDNDTLTVSVSAPDSATATEGDSVTFTFRHAGSTPTASVQVLYSVSLSGLGEEDIDVTSLLNPRSPGFVGPPGPVARAFLGSVTIAQGQASTEIEIAITDDTEIEPDGTLTVALTNVVSAGEVEFGDPASASVTIEDDDRVLVSVSAVAASVNEGSGSMLQFNLMASQEFTEATTVSWMLGGTALRGVDYTGNGVATGQPTTMTYSTVMPANTSSARVEFALVDDTLNEAAETITMILAAPAGRAFAIGTQGEGMITIEDDDTLMVSVSAPDPATVLEGDSVTFTVRHDGSTPTGDVVVDYTISSGEGLVDAQDIDGNLTGSVTILQGQASAEIEVMITDDAEIEPDETLTVELTDARSAGAVEIVATTASVTIEDNDSVQVSVSVVAASVDEDSGSMLQFNLMATRELREATTVSWMLGGTALRGVDYTMTGVTAGQPTTMTYSTVMPANTSSARVEFALVDDTLNEAAETITMILIAPAEGEGMITIEDDDTLMVSVSAPDTTMVSEGDSVIFTVRHAGSTPTGDVVVDYTISSGEGFVDAQDIDGGDLTGSVTIMQGQASTEIEVIITDDAIFEPTETLTLALTAARSAGAVEIVATATTASVTVQPSDSAFLTVAARAATVGEGAGEAVFTLQYEDADGNLLSASPVAGATTALVNYSLGGVAVAASDYEGAATRSVVVAFGSAEEVSVSVLDDALNEASETLTLTLGVISLNGEAVDYITVSESSGMAQVTLTDNDPITVSITGPTDLAEEGTTAIFTVLLSGAADGSAADIDIPFTLTGASDSDYNAPSSPLRIAAGNTSEEIALFIIDDDLNEADETVTAMLSAAPTVASGGGAVTLDTDTDARTASVTIAENDPLEVNLTPASQTVQEGSTATVQMSVSGGTALASFVVEYRITGDSADYTGSSTGEVVIGTDGNGQLEIGIVYDELAEAAEDLTVALTSVSIPAGGGEIAPGFPLSVTVTIAASTVPSRTLTVTGPATIAEGDDAVQESGDYTITLTGDPFSEATAVTWRVVHGTTGDADFTTSTGMVMFDSTDTANTFRLAIAGDNLNEAAESFMVAVSVADRAADGGTRYAAPSATTITDDDAITVSIAPQTQTVNEGADAGFMLTLAGGDPTADVIVRYSISGTGITDDDIAGGLAGMFTIDTRSAGTVAVTLGTLSDGVDEGGTETLTLTLSSGESAGTVNISATDDTADVVLMDFTGLRMRIRVFLEGAVIP